jgi:guanyl-specific ribonuclease Sa
LSQPLRYDYEESQRILSNSIMQNDKERAIFKQKLEALLAFDAQSPGYFSGVGESEALLNEGLILLGGDPATGKVGAGSWNGQGFTPIVSDWQQRVNDQWTKRVERQEQARAAEFEQAAQGRTYQRVQLASGAYQWLWVKDSGKITQEDLQFNEKYADYLAILNAPEENMVDEYYQNMLEELRTGINTKTGKPLTTLEKAQRWSAVASFVAVLAIGSYYSVKGLTGTKTTAKQPKSTTKATGPKAKLPSDTTQGRQLKVKKADIPKGKSRNIAAPKKAGGTGTPSIPNKSLNNFPENVKNSYEKYSKNGWKGNVEGQTPGTKAGRTYKNREGKLPSMDENGNPITYGEFDVNNKLPNAKRDKERFIKGSDGSIYYTKDHYNSFIKIE